MRLATPLLKYYHVIEMLLSDVMPQIVEKVKTVKQVEIENQER
jgi:hypothetical protein